MAIATGCLKEENISRNDYEQMADYIRCKEYNNALVDTLMILKNSDTLEDGIKKINMLNEYCEKMRYMVIQRMFSL
jgi:hypothetical protein